MLDSKMMELQRIYFSFKKIGKMSEFALEHPAFKQINMQDLDMNCKVGILESEYTSNLADVLQTMMGPAQIPRI